MPKHRGIDIGKGVKHLVFFDGVCGLCSSLVQFILPRDAKDNFHFAPLQSELAQQKLSAYGKDPNDLNTVYVLKAYATPDEKILSESTAILLILSELGGAWAIMGVFQIVPKFIRDAMYRFIAKNRYRWFGKNEVCMLPESKHKTKFLE